MILIMIDLVMSIINLLSDMKVAITGFYFLPQFILASDCYKPFSII